MKPLAINFWVGDSMITFQPIDSTPMILQPSPGQISASIVLFRTPEHLLQRVYASVTQSGIPINLLLIDNSPQPCIEPTDFPAAHYIFMGKNEGYGAGHNIAIKKILNSSTYHFVLNPDISFEPLHRPGIPLDTHLGTIP